jgi:hypothetical protein
MTDLNKIYLAEGLLEELKLFLRNIKKSDDIPLPWPFSDVKYQSTIKLFNDLYDDSNKLLAISKEIAEQVQLEDDETFCCFLFVANKPNYLTEALGIMQVPSSKQSDPTPEPAYRMLALERYPFAELDASAWPFIRYNKITDPAIMKAMIDNREADRIDYSSK